MVDKRKYYTNLSTTKYVRKILFHKQSCYVQRTVWFKSPYQKFHITQNYFSIIGNPQIHRKFKDSITDTQKWARLHFVKKSHNYYIRFTVIILEITWRLSRRTIWATLWIWYKLLIKKWNHLLGETNWPQD